MKAFVCFIVRLCVHIFLRECLRVFVSVCLLACAYLCLHLYGLSVFLCYTCVCVRGREVASSLPKYRLNCWIH